MSNDQPPALMVSKSRAAKAWRARSRAGVLFVLIAAAAPCSGAAQELILTADVGKRTFFEGEPIYFMVQLQNVGTDTAWVYFFNLFSPAVSLSVSRGPGNPIPVSKRIRSYRVPPNWRGAPIAPGARVLNTIVLQDIVGDAWDSRSHLFRHHLAPGDYDVRVEFDAHGGLLAATPMTLRADPVVFHVRVPTADEEREVTELQAMRKMGWDTTRIAGSPLAARYKAALISWVERRLTLQPNDPFLPFLLYEGLYGAGQILSGHYQAGELQRFDPDTSELVSQLRLAVIERQRASTAGAHLVQALSARHPDQIAFLATRLRGTAAGHMAQHQVERNQHGQHVHRPPR